MAGTCRWARSCVGKHKTHVLTHAIPSSSTSQTHYWQQFSDGLCDCQYCGSAPGASAPHQRWLDYPDVCTPRHLTISQHLHMQPQHSTLLLMRACEGSVCEASEREKTTRRRRRKEGRNGSPRSLNVKQTNFNPTPSPSSSKPRRK